MRSQILTLMLLALLAGTPALAGEHDHGKSRGKGLGSVFCPHCGEACYPTVTKGKETKVCFETEFKTICIPKVRFPWQGAGLNLSFGHSHGKGKGNCTDCGGKNGCGGKDGCSLPTKCGRTRDVNLLLKHEYECTVCKYSWDPAGFKNDSKNDAKKYMSDPEPAAGGPAVPLPPSIEARVPATGVFVRPVSDTQTRVDAAATPATSRETRSGIFSSFFK